LKLALNPHLIVPQKSEQTAQACDIAWFRQLSTRERAFPLVADNLCCDLIKQSPTMGLPNSDGSAAE
jgi:hypothetical protein